MVSEWLACQVWYQYVFLYPCLRAFTHFFRLVEEDDVGVLLFLQLSRVGATPIRTLGKSDHHSPPSTVVIFSRNHVGKQVFFNSLSFYFLVVQLLFFTIRSGSGCGPPWTPGGFHIPTCSMPHFPCSCSMVMPNEPEGTMVFMGKERGCAKPTPSDYRCMHHRHCPFRSCLIPFVSCIRRSRRLLRFRDGVVWDGVLTSLIDYPTTIWATHSLGGVISYVLVFFSQILSQPHTHSSGANPDFTTPELVYQLEQTSATLLVVHPDVKSVAYEAAAKVGLGKDRVLVFGRPGEGKMDDTQMRPKAEGTCDVEDVVRFGRGAKRTFVERKFAKGEAKKKLAFLSFSSGTTGRPKVRSIAFHLLFHHFPLSLRSILTLPFPCSGCSNPALCTYRKCVADGCWTSIQ